MPRFIQAVMELIDRQEYISWKLPKGWTIILTANPDNGDYMVNSLDSAQKTRFISVVLKFDVKVWANWAEGANVDGRCINFLLLHPELVSQDVNARSITKFFDGISSIKVFEKELGLISMIGDGSVGPEFSALFAEFIGNNLDKMISPERMLNHKEKNDILKEIEECVGTGDNYRQDLGSILARRFTNHILHFSKGNAITEKMIERIKDITTEKCFGTDLQYYCVKELLAKDREKFRGLMMFKEVAETMLSDE